MKLNNSEFIYWLLVILIFVAKDSDFQTLFLKVTSYVLLGNFADFRQNEENPKVKIILDFFALLLVGIAFDGLVLYSGHGLGARDLHRRQFDLPGRLRDLLVHLEKLHGQNVSYSLRLH